ncbi:(Fe-S)-binding protein [Arhodomonas sp. AD133]|uniref:(Fe-S)-binding protein n=1 Tax=Arhodomonas sp. AD133 TaxID=3415009 RepID=UPI003EB79ECD
MTDTKASDRPRVGLFATCLVDLFRPNVGFASVRLLEQAGCSVEVPKGQTCCGQPAYNNGDLDDARGLARQTIDAFRDCDYLVAPSGSCLGQIRKYPDLFDADEPLRGDAERLAARSWELFAFLVDVRGMGAVSAEFKHTVTYHDSCSGLRQLGVRSQPRALLGSVEGLKLTEMEDTDVCCGFGGTFCVKYPDISQRLVDDKSDRIADSGADTVLAGDLGCLMNIAGRLRRRGVPVRAYHAAEVLAGMTDGPAIGEEG